MKLSIIVPVYNTEKYIHRCVESLINQSVKDYEIILVDDGSPDNCPKICDEYAEKYANIKVIHKTNGGLSSARNAGLRAADGDFVAFADSDDFVHRDMYKILISECEKNDCDTGFAKWQKFADEKEIKSSDTGTYESYVYDTKKLLVSDYVKMDHIYPTSVCVKVYRRELFHSLSFNENIPYLEDVCLKPELMLKSTKCARVNLPLYFYFVQNNSSLVAGRKNKKHSNITVDIYTNKVIWENNTEKKEIITQNKLFSVLYTFGKMASYYNKNQLEKSSVEIKDFYSGKIKDIKNIWVKILWSAFLHNRYRLLKMLCSVSFDIYKTSAGHIYENKRNNSGI